MRADSLFYQVIAALSRRTSAFVDIRDDGSSLARNLTAAFRRNEAKSDVGPIEMPVAAPMDVQAEASDSTPAEPVETQALPTAPSNLNGANLQGADLDEVDLNDAFMLGANLRGARLVRAQLRNARMYRADLTLVDARGAVFANADLTEVEMESANLTGANLAGANLSRANLKGSDLSGAVLLGTVLSRTNLSQVKLYGADLFGAEQIRVHLLIGARWDVNTRWAPHDHEIVKKVSRLANDGNMEVIGDNQDRAGVRY